MSTEQPVSTAPATLAPDAVTGLRDRLRGPLLEPGDDGYEAARTVWNRMIDRRPTLIARCRGAADVIAAVEFAREHDVLLSVRGGGHSVSGKAVCEGGLMIDLSPMKGIRVDPAGRTARADPGVVWGEFDRETHAFGLATPGGVVATTGIAGLTLGGGQSWLTGKHGLTVDNLLSVDVVTADGRLLHASKAENEDLFWGMRGAGANFGVATSFEYRLHPVDTVLGGMVLHPLADARDVLRFYRDFSRDQPDELTTYAAFITTPDGQQVVGFIACYAGPVGQGGKALQPLREFGSPVADTIAPISYPEMQMIITAADPPDRLSYWKSGLTDEITDEAIDIVVDYVKGVPSPRTAVVFADCHGAYSRVGRTETAYVHRDLQYDLVVMSLWTDPDTSDRNVRWTRELFDAVRPQLDDGVYVNDLGDEDEQRVRNAYGENYERLVELKTTYDPTNLFRMNQNIRPKD